MSVESPIWSAPKLAMFGLMPPVPAAMSTKQPTVKSQPRDSSQTVVFMSCWCGFLPCYCIEENQWYGFMALWLCGLMASWHCGFMSCSWRKKQVSPTAQRISPTSPVACVPFLGDPKKAWQIPGFPFESLNPAPKPSGTGTLRHLHILLIQKLNYKNWIPQAKDLYHGELVLPHRRARLKKRGRPAVWADTQKKGPDFFAKPSGKNKRMTGIPKGSP